MRRLPIALVVFSLGTLSASADCPCQKPEKGETTHRGGNQLIIQVEESSYKELTGVVLDQNGDPRGALVEVWTNPEYLLRRTPQSPKEKAGQKRVKACRAGADGKFCFRIKPGHYEVRVSIGPGWDVTQAYVVVDPQNGASSILKIHMVLGT
jgi:hypothetical protein